MAHPAEDRLGNLLAAVSLAMTGAVDAAVARSTGLAGTGPAALLALEQFLDGCNVTRLAAVFGLTHSGAVRLASQLQAAGYLRREQLADKRQVNLVLTDAGRAAARRAAAARLQVARHAVELLPESDRGALEAVVVELVDRMVTERAERRLVGDQNAAWWCRTCNFTACGRDDGRCPAMNAAAAVLDENG